MGTLRPHWSHLTLLLTGCLPILGTTATVQSSTFQSNMNQSSAYIGGPNNSTQRQHVESTSIRTSHSIQSVVYGTNFTTNHTINNLFRNEKEKDSNSEYDKQDTSMLSKLFPNLDNDYKKSNTNDQLFNETNNSSSTFDSEISKWPWKDWWEDEKSKPHSCPEGYRWFINKCRQTSIDVQTPCMKDIAKESKNQSPAFKKSDEKNEIPVRIADAPHISDDNETVRTPVAVEGLEFREAPLTSSRNNKNSKVINYDEPLPLKVGAYNESDVTTTKNPDELDVRVVINIPRFAQTKLLIEAKNCSEGFKWFENKCKEIFNQY